MSEQTIYQYTGRTASGYRVKAEIEAPSLVIAKLKLHQQGILPKRLQKKRQRIPLRKAIHQTELSFLSRQLATMVASGIPLAQSFEIILKDLNKPALSQLIKAIKQDLEIGLSLHESLGKHPRYFNALHCQLIRAGEHSGALEQILMQIANYREKMEATKKKVKKALSYPIAVFFIASAITLGLLLFVVPQFESLFKEFGATLPPLTQAVLALSRILYQYWPGLLVMLTLPACLIYGLQHNPWLKSISDELLLKLPRMGILLKQAAIARFTRTLAITFAAGLPLVEALDSVSGATANTIYTKACHYIKEAVTNGELLSASIQKTALFPPLVIQMISVGEESGRLEYMLQQLATFYEEEVQHALDSFTNLLEPLLMSFLGILIAGLMLSMYLPLFKLGAI